MYWDEEYQDKEMYEWYKQLLWIRKKHASISEGELIGAITKDEEETIVLIRKNVEETIALIFNCSSNAKNFSEYEGKYNLLRDEPFNGKVEGCLLYTSRKLNRQRSVLPSDTALLKALYLATFEATKKWTMSIRNWGQVYGELSIMYEGRLPE